MDKSKLLADRVSASTTEVEIEGVGTVTVRALSRAEMILGGKLADDPLEQEQFILRCAMVDPPMTKDDVAQWQRVSPPGEINRVAEVVNELSGIGKGAAKSGLPPVRDQS